MYKYKTVETFTSIQGEGSLTGTNMFFIRMFGCNLNCSFCDEPLHKDERHSHSYSLDDLVTMAKNAGTKWVCITGGEPSLRDMNPLILKLQAEGFKVQVESNGYKTQHIDAADNLTISPKDFGTSISDADDIKLVVSRDMDWDTETLHYYKDRCSNLYLQPMNHKDGIDLNNIAYCLEVIKKYPFVGLSVQLHKILGVD